MPTVGRRQQLPLPANGHELAEITAKEFQAELIKYLKPHLAYPNAQVKIQWSISFTCTPNNYSGDILLKVSSDKQPSTDEEVDQGMEMGSLEIGVQSPAAPTAVTRPGIPSSNLPPSLTESRGRRDITARRGRGIEFMAGQPASEELASISQDQSAIVNRKAAEVTADLEKGNQEVKANEFLPPVLSEQLSNEPS